MHRLKEKKEMRMFFLLFFLTAWHIHAHSTHTGGPRVCFHLSSFGILLLLSRRPARVYTHHRIQITPFGHVTAAHSLQCIAYMYVFLLPTFSFHFHPTTFLSKFK
jgi:hypothetical protein